VGQINSTLASGAFVGNVLVDIIGGSQNTGFGNDITTLMHKVEVGIYYAEQLGQPGITWTLPDDGPDATALVDAVTDDPASVLMGVARADQFILADLGP
jgi:hypothetical protein